MKLNYATLAIIVCAAIFFLFYAAKLAWTPQHILGVAIVAPSLVLLIIARLQLADAFSIRARASKLVTTGLYSRVRNPIYVFSSLILAGVIIFAGRPIWFLALALIVLLQVRRGRKESRVLEEKFGDEYRAYKSRTWI